MSNISNFNTIYFYNKDRVKNKSYAVQAGYLTVRGQRTYFTSLTLADLLKLPIKDCIFISTDLQYRALKDKSIKLITPNDLNLADL